MNENINLYEILKDCPREAPLYSPMYGEVYFSHIDGDSDDGVVCVYKHKLSKGCTRCIYRQDRDIVTFYSNGTTGNLDFNVTDECMLYPSKNQRDWSKWECPKSKKPKFDPKSLKPFQRVLVRDREDFDWFCDFFSHVHGTKFYCTSTAGFKYAVPYNDDTKHLVGTSDEAPDLYKYWED